MPKVFIPNKSSHNFEKAEEFGELHYVTEGNVNRYATNKLYRKVVKELRHSSPDDYIVITGLPELQIVLTSVFVRMHGRLNLLLFQSRNGAVNYVVRELVIGDFNGAKNQTCSE